MKTLRKSFRFAYFSQQSSSWEEVSSFCSSKLSCFPCGPRSRSGNAPTTWSRFSQRARDETSFLFVFLLVDIFPQSDSMYQNYIISYIKRINNSIFSYSQTKFLFVFRLKLFYIQQLRKWILQKYFQIFLYFLRDKSIFLKLFFIAFQCS
jgi:hypothetical protein